jgi:hypothetical protein
LPSGGVSFLLGHCRLLCHQTYNRYGYSPEMKAAWELWATHIDKLVKQNGAMRAAA